MGFEDHTEEDVDDCKLFTRNATPRKLQKYGHLDFYYDASAVVGKYQAMLNAAIKKHQDVMQQLSSMTLPSGLLESLSDFKEVFFDVIWNIAINKIEPSV